MHDMVHHQQVYVHHCTCFHADACWRSQQFCATSKQALKARLLAAEDALKKLKEMLASKTKEVQQLEADKDLLSRHAQSVESENRY